MSWSGWADHGGMYTYKWLRLASPELANAYLPVPVESPAPVSPVITKDETCPPCDTTIRPLIYLLDRATVSLHRGVRCPGIYVTHDTELPHLQPGFSTPFPVLAIGFTDCHTKAQGIFDCNRPRSFIPRQFLVFCRYCDRLCDEGIVVAYGVREILAATHARCIRDGERWTPRYAFTVRGGHILFANLEENYD